MEVKVCTSITIYNKRTQLHKLKPSLTPVENAVWREPYCLNYLYSSTSQEAPNIYPPHPPIPLETRQFSIRTEIQNTIPTIEVQPKMVHTTHS